MHTHIGIVMTNQRRPVRKTVVKVWVSEHIVDQIASSSGLASNCWLFLLSDSGDAVVANAALNEFWTFPLAQFELRTDISFVQDVIG